MPNPGPAITNTPQTKVAMVPINTNAAQNQTPNELNGLRLLGIVRSVNVNAVADVAIPILNAASYSVFQVVAVNASISLTTATGGLFTDVAGGGTAIVATAALAGLTAANIVSQRTVASTTVRTEQTLYWRTAVAQGAAATMDVYVYGYDLTAYVNPT